MEDFNMKKFIFTCLLSVFCFTILAQDNAGLVSISAVQPTYENIPDIARANLETKMQRIISNCGLASSAADRFIMTARVDITEKEINTVGMIVQRMEITFIVGDVQEEKVYGTTTIQSMGVGETEAKCFINAFQSIKPNHPTLKEFINKMKDDIVSYYSNNCQFIIQDADRMVGLQQYGEAIATLIAVPRVCADCYTMCQAKAIEIFNMQIELEGKQLIQDARSAWLVKRDYDCAIKALDILAKVNPTAECQVEANALIQDINTQLRKIEAEEAAAAKAKAAAEAAAAKAQWEFKVRQYEDKYALDVQKQADKAAILNTFANRFGKIDIGIKKEKAFKFGSLK